MVFGINMSQEKEPDAYGFAFTLGGGVVEYHLNNAEGTAFKQCWNDAIESTETFYSKKEMDSYKTTVALSTPSKAKQVSDDDKSPSDGSDALNDAEKELLNSIKQGIDQDRPTCKIELHYRSTAMSTVAAVILRFKGLDATDDWRIKCEAVKTALKQYHDKIPAADDTIQYFINSFELSEQRDPQKSDTSTLYHNWKSPSSGKSKKFPYKLICSIMPIPYANLSSALAEDAYLRNKLHQTGLHIKRVMGSAIFKHCYEYALNQPSIWKAISDPDKPKNYYRDFVSGCAVSVVKCSKMTTHIVKHDAQLLFNTLFHNRLSRVKYPQVRQIRPLLPSYAQLHLTAFYRPRTTILPRQPELRLMTQQTPEQEARARVLRAARRTDVLFRKLRKNQRARLVCRRKLRSIRASNPATPKLLKSPPSAPAEPNPT